MFYFFSIPSQLSIFSLDGFQVPSVEVACDIMKKKLNLPKKEKLWLRQIPVENFTLFFSANELIVDQKPFIQPNKIAGGPVCIEVVHNDIKYMIIAKEIVQGLIQMHIHIGETHEVRISQLEMNINELCRAFNVMSNRMVCIEEQLYSSTAHN